MNNENLIYKSPTGALISAHDYQFLSDNQKDQCTIYRPIESPTSPPTSHTEELSTPPVREVKSVEELEKMFHVHFGYIYDQQEKKINPKEIVEWFSKQSHNPTPHKEGYSVEDMEKAVEFGFRQCKKYDYISPSEETQFLNQLKK